MMLSPHFALAEFSSPVYAGPTGKARALHKERPPQRVIPNLRRLCAALETIRAAAGGALVVISGWRSVEFNKRNKGRASTSTHLDGLAADLVLQGDGDEQARQRRLYWSIAEVQGDGLIPAGGLAYYPGRWSAKLRRNVGSFVHYDIRGRNARWLARPPAR